MERLVHEQTDTRSKLHGPKSQVFQHAHTTTTAPAGARFTTSILPLTNTQPAGSAVDARGGKTRRDANPTRLAQFRKSQQTAHQAFFAALDPEQLHLQILATLPPFQRRGHATSLCEWAMERVRQDDALHGMSVMASPMGYRLYTRLRFEEAGTFYVQVPGEEERLVLRAMVYKPARAPGKVVVEKVPDLEGGLRCLLV